MTQGKSAFRDNKHKSLPSGTMSHAHNISHKNQENIADDNIIVCSANDTEMTERQNEHKLFKGSVRPAVTK